MEKITKAYCTAPCHLIQGVVSTLELQDTCTRANLQEANASIPKNTSLHLDRMNCLRRIQPQSGNRGGVYEKTFDPRLATPSMIEETCGPCFYTQSRSEGCILYMHVHRRQG